MLCSKPFLNKEGVFVALFIAIAFFAYSILVEYVNGICYFADSINNKLTNVALVHALTSNICGIACSMALIFSPANC